MVLAELLLLGVLLANVAGAKFPVPVLVQVAPSAYWYVAVRLKGIHSHSPATGLVSTILGELCMRITIESFAEQVVDGSV